MEAHNISNALRLCPWHRFYRVDYTGSQTSWVQGQGFQARDSTTRYMDRDSFRDSIINAFWNGDHRPSPYIFVFSDESHAENWARAMHHKYTAGGSDFNFWIFTLDASRLDSTAVFRLSTLAHNLDITLSEGAQQHNEGAYLCMHKIAATSVVSIEDKSTVLARKIHIGECRQSLTKAGRPRREVDWDSYDGPSNQKWRPGTDWVDDLHGWYSSGSEMEEHNLHDDIVNANE